MHLFESDSQKLGGVLLTYPSGYQQQITWHGSCSGSLREMGQELATRALDNLLSTGRQADASNTNWASVAAGCGELHRVWKSRVRG
jgi:hypothetical protein